MKFWLILLLSFGLISGCNETKVSNAESSPQLTETNSETSSESHDEEWPRGRNIGIKQAFPQLTWIDVSQDKDMLDTQFGYSPDSFKLIQTRLENLPPHDSRYDANNYEDYFLVGEYQNQTMAQAVNLLYSDGPSIDPHFIITDKNNTTIWSEMADNLALLDNGIIYTSGRINRMFHLQMKFKLSKGKIREVAQPFYYVGESGKLLKPITIYSRKYGGEVVASLPIGAEVEVLLAEVSSKQDEDHSPGAERNYLLRTPFGLVGWLHLTDEETQAVPVVDSLRYWGD